MLFTKARRSNKTVKVGGENVVEIYINTVFDDKVLKLLQPSYPSFWVGRGGGRGTAYVTVWNIYPVPRINKHTSSLKQRRISFQSLFRHSHRECAVHTNISHRYIRQDDTHTHVVNNRYEDILNSWIRSSHGIEMTNPPYKSHNDFVSP